MPRLEHSKSRKGCTRCKQRKVKCDEVKPICSACAKHNVSCHYPNLAITVWEMRSSSGSGVDRKITPEVASSRKKAWELASRGRYDIRSVSETPPSDPKLELDFFPKDFSSQSKLEFRLMHHWSISTSLTFSRVGDILWQRLAPVLAEHNDCILNEILSFSALHLSRLHPERTNYLFLSRMYFQRALTRHRKALENLSEENHEAIIIATCLFSLHAFALIGFESYPLSSSTAHIDSIINWYYFASHISTVFQSCRQWSRRSLALRTAMSTHALADREFAFHPENRKDLHYLLEFKSEEEAATPSETKAYEDTLSYIGLAHTLASAGAEEPKFTQVRLLGMPTVCPTEFVSMVTQKRPRALVMLAYMFAITHQIPSERWWAQGVFGPKIRAIVQELPQKWKPLCAWPLAVMEEDEVGFMPANQRLNVPSSQVNWTEVF